MPRTEALRIERAIDVTVAGVIRRYHAREDMAERIVRDTLRTMPALLSVLKTEKDFSKVERTRIFKEFQKTIRKKVYYALRQYHDGGEEGRALKLEALADDDHATAIELMRDLADSHVSTRERLPHLETFRDVIAKSLGNPRSVLDIGSGVMPLIFEFERFKGLETYWACDRDPTVIRTLRAATRFLGDGRLHARIFEIEKGFGEVLAAAGVEYFDAALLLQLVPVVKRRDPKCIEILARTPARRLVVTGARQSMTKRQDITARERRTLLEFAKVGGFNLRSEFETPNEIGLVLERP